MISTSCFQLNQQTMIEIFGQDARNKQCERSGGDWLVQEAAKTLRAQAVS